jgi:hypothetical protein
MLVIWVSPLWRVGADALEADVGLQSAGTIKIEFHVRCLG